MDEDGYMLLGLIIIFFCRERQKEYEEFKKSFKTERLKRRRVSDLQTNTDLQLPS